MHNRRKVILTLTAAEARGLLAMAGEGAAGLLTDDGAARAYIGNAASLRAAESALVKLRDATPARD